MLNFTKGKWTYDAKKGFITSDGYTIITVCYPETKEAQSIGRLVEAAPDMYDELVYILGYLYEAQGIATNTQYKHKVSNDIKRIEALIARIDGNDMKGGEA